MPHVVLQNGRRTRCLAPRALLTSTALASTSLIVAGVLQMASAQSLPTGGTVAAGSVTINPTSSSNLVINQTSQQAITNWQSFSIGAGNSVAVVQPSTSASMLARVTGSTTSTIAGSLTATGQLMLVNPNGISITPTGTVNAGTGFVATTLGISDSKFLSGNWSLTGTGTSNAVSNAGTITVGPGGYAALIGGTVSNSGTISVPMGKVGLGSGEVTTLDFSGDGFLQVGVPTNAPGTGALVSNAGKIVANGGTVEIKAAAARDAARQAINMSGVVEARSVRGTDGDITLDGGDGTVAVSGKLTVASRKAKAGTITVTGRDIKLTGAQLNATGKTGGGTIRIGGDRQGKGTLAHATTTTIDAATKIKADATGTGTGGNVVVWSDAQTNFDGWISAKGGTTGGDGGQVEVSSHGVLAYTGKTVLTAPMGKTGTLLLDPYNVTISNGSDTDPMSAVSAGSSSFTPGGNDSVLSVATLQSALSAANVTVSTGSSGTQAGDITVAAPLTWSANTLTLDAYHSINIIAAVTVGGTGGLTLKTNDGGTGGDYSFGLTNSGFTGRVDFTGTPGQQALTINGAAYTLESSLASLASDANATPSGNYALAGNVDGSNGGAGYTAAPITTFTGNFTGLGHTVSNLTINSTTTNAAVGLFGTVTAGSVRDVGIVGGSITGVDAQPSYPNPNGSLGALVGFANANSSSNIMIADAYATTSVSGGTSGYVGGLIGQAQVKSTGALTISNVHASGTATAGDYFARAGGLIGEVTSNGTSAGQLTITNSYATGLASGGTYSVVGGLVGGVEAAGQPISISNVYATGAAVGQFYVGGLIGVFQTGGASSSYSQISLSHAFATGSAAGGYDNGGLIGYVSAVGNSSNAISIDSVFATSAIVGAASSQNGGLIGYIYSGAGPISISNGYALGAVTTLNGYGANVAGVVGQTYGSVAVTVSNLYWNTDTSGTGTGVGQNLSGLAVSATGLTTAQLQGSLPSGFSSSDWGTGTGLYPYLTSFFPNGIQAVSGTVYRDLGTTSLASGINGPVPVSVIGANTLLGSGTTFADGSYYVFGAAGTIGNGAGLVAYTTQNGTSGVTNAARLASSTYTSGTPVQTGVDIYAPVTLFAATTSAATYSASGYNPASAPALPTGSTLPSFLNGAIPTLVATNSAGFTIDQTLDLTTGFAVQTTASNAPITVANAITVESGAALGLNAAGALTINAPITVNGTGSIALAASYDTTTAPGFSLLNLSFAPGASIDYGATNTGGALSINGQSYSLLYSMSDVAAVNTNLAARYAVATNLDATGNTYTGAVIAPGYAYTNPAFSGTLDGLGHSIANLSIANTTDSVAIGLIGINSGTVRDLNLVGGLVATTGIANQTGALVGYNWGLVANVSSSVVVTGSIRADYIGGLVGFSDGSSQNVAIVNASSTGSVSIVSGNVGGLVGLQQGRNGYFATIANSFATGAVSTASGSAAGGLAGVSQAVDGGTASITNSYATGAVSTVSGSAAGGLVGLNQSVRGGAVASLSNVYATGVVSASGSQSTVGGLIGFNAIYDQGTTPASTTPITNAYWDKLTSGQTAAIGSDSANQAGNIVGLTTAQLQDGSSAASLGGAFTLTSGLYPYLTSFYPNGVQAISGIAYNNAGTTPAASGANGAVTVTAFANNTSFGSATTGANGYYYILGAAGSITSGYSLLAYTSANATTGATNSATLATATSAANQSGLNLYGNTLTIPTTRTTLSSAYLQATLDIAKSAARSATGFDSTASAAINAVTGLGFVASGASFTIDETIDSASPLFVQTTASGASITVANAITVEPGGSVGFNAAGALTINAPITVKGAGGVALAFDQNTTTPSATDLSFGLTASGFTSNLTYTDASGNALTSSPGNQSLSINGAAYTLLYSMADVANVNNGLSGNYALAGNLDATGNSYTAGVIAGGDSSGTLPTPFSGTLEGLGHTISNLAIGGASNYYAGLIGYSTGTIRDVGVIGVVVGGFSNIGGLAGENDGTLVSAYATGTVTASYTAGGLTSYNNGTISNAYATVAVSGIDNLGGLAGRNNGRITNAYATGSVSGTGVYMGGLVGYNFGGGTISDAYATGAVKGSVYVGGIAGQNDGAINRAYAIGAVGVFGGQGSVGGVTGFNRGTVANSYFDINTTGQTSDPGGATGLTTAQFQTSAAASNLGAAFGGGAGLYPYLKSFYPNGVQAISGMAYLDSGVTLAASSTNGPRYVYVDVAGTQTAVTTGANGTYYVALANGTLSSANGGTATLAYMLDGNVVGPVSGAHLAQLSGTATRFDVWTHNLIAPTTATSLSGAPPSAALLLSANSGANQTVLASAAGSDAAPTSAALGNLSSVGYVATGANGFTIDQGISPYGLYAQTTSGPITVSAAQTLGGPINLSLYSAGALNLNAPIQVNGAGSVNLVYDASNPTNLSFGLTAAGFTGGLTFANADGSQAPSSQGGKLSINGTAYTLLYSMADVAMGNTGLSGTYALAGNLTASGTYTDAPIANSHNSFTGQFEGLGHTISGLSVTNSANYYALGLFGINAGTIRDVGLVGASVATTGDYTGVGLLAGNTDTNSSIANVYATGSASATGTTDTVGGLVGSNRSQMTNAFANARVSIVAPTGQYEAAGGLVGQLDGGTINTAYATGAVSISGFGYAGGLVGVQQQGGMITNAYATGAVSGGNDYASSPGVIGGLVGQTLGAATLNTVYATGSVSGVTVGGLVGAGGATLTNAYFDINTTGQTSDAAGATGLTTAQLQTASAATNLGAAFGGGAGLYPYLKSFYPNGVQAISGTAYSDGGMTLAASNANGAKTVVLDIAGSRTTVTTGANGYYYTALPNGTLSSANGGTATLAYTLSGSAVTGATLTTASDTTRNLDIWGNTFIAPTMVTSLSSAPNAAGLVTANSTLLATAAGQDATPTGTALGALSNAGYIATGNAGFTIDQAVPTSGLYVQTTSGPITVNAGQELTGPINLTLLSAGALNINSLIQVDGAGSINLAYDASSPTNLSFGLTSAGFTGGLVFAGVNGSATTTSAGGALAINGTAYTLLYSMSDVAIGNAGLSGNYALAGNITASGTYTDAPIASGNNSFSGQFEGLGHTISNLTISGGSNSEVGLIGFLTGAARDIGLSGGSVSGNASVGGLAGVNVGTIVNAFATGAVNGTGAFVGGLAGINEGTIVHTYSTGAVNGTGGNVGGLVGYNYGFLIGLISDAYATGAVNGTGGNVGGLAGLSTGTIVHTYATGAVNGTGGNVGGLVGDNHHGLISDAYATGAVSGNGSVGGLVGHAQNGTLTNGYYDINTTGQTTDANGATGLTTAQLQISAAASALGSAFGGGAGLYPYLLSFNPNGVQAISGTVYTSGTTVLASGTGGAGLVTVKAGNASQTVTTGANGYYYAAFANGTIDTTNGTGVLAYTQTNANTGATNAATFNTKVTGTLSGLNIAGNTLTETADVGIGSLSTLDTAYANAALNTPVSGATFPNLAITSAASGFSVDQSVSQTGTVAIASAGSLSIAQGTTVTGSDVTLSATGAFVNNEGSDAVTATSGRWLIYSANPTNDTFGSLDSGNTAVWNTAAGGTVSATGNRYVFAYRPTLTVSTVNDSKTYGDDATTAVAGDYTITGLQNGVTVAYLGDTASVYSGAASVTSQGATVTAGVRNGGYAYALGIGTLASSGYAFSLNTAGTFTVNTRAITVTADAQTQVYGDAVPTLTYAVGGLGLVNGDTLSGSLATTASTTTGIGTYAITQGSLAATGNYALTYIGANDVIGTRAITVVADAKTQTYGNATPALTYAVGGLGLANGDTLAGSLATSATSTSNVGGYAITQGSITNGNNANYSITYTGANDIIGTRAITVTADAQSRIYGNANPALTYTIGGLGLVNGDTLTGSLTTSATTTSNVGQYAITQGTVAVSSNYALTYTGANLTVGTRALTITADAQSRIYGNANPTLTYAVGGLGLVNGDTLTGNLTTSATAASAVGQYAITQGSVAASSNYALTYVGANLTVGTRAITVTADAQSRIYGNANPTFTYTVGGLGLVNGDLLSGGLATTASATSGIGTYAITQGSLAASGNYALTYTGSNLTVGTRAITVTADAQSRSYGVANPTLTYAVGGLGLANGDTLAGSLATSATSTSNVGSYAITQGTLAASSNYALTYYSANLTVGARALTVTADAKYRIYGNANPALTYSIGGLGLVNGDTLTGGLVTSATPTSPIGAYAITQGTLSAPANYALTYLGALLTIVPNTPPTSDFGNAFGGGGFSSWPTSAPSPTPGPFTGFTSPGFDTPDPCAPGRVCGAP